MRLVARLAWATAIVPLFLIAGTGTAMAVTQYHDNAALDAALRQVADRGGFGREELCRDSRGEPVWLVSAGSRRAEDPAMLVVAGLDGRHLVGSEVALGILDILATRDDSTRALLESRTLYVIPRVNRAGADAFFSKTLRYGMAAKPGVSDADRDGLADEDLYEDLDGDGMIRWMRVRDARGAFVLEGPDSSFVRKADPLKGELGVWRWIREGRDEDGDRRFHEEADGGVLLSRNFTQGYEFFAKGSGPYQVSEVETRAIADFLASHPNIGTVLVFGFEDNLLTPLPEGKKSSPRLSGGRFGRKPVDAPNESDLPIFLEVARRYREDLGLGEKKRVGMGEYGRWPEAEGDGASLTNEVAARGGLAAWVYYTRGRAAFGTPVWTPGLQMSWVKRDDAASESADTDPDSSAVAADSTDADADSTGTSRGGGRAGRSDSKSKDGDAETAKVAEERAFRDWWVAQDASAWRDWAPISHPDFPGQRVEVGGYDPFSHINPPAAMIDSLVPPHRRLVHRLLAQTPRVVVRDLRLRSLGGGVHELTFTVENLGEFPDLLAQGVYSTHVRATRVELTVPQGSEVLGSPSRFALDRLEGAGADVEVRRLVRLAGNGPVTVAVISELGGRVEESVRPGGGR